MKLSDQVEAATGADRELDARVAVATGWTDSAGKQWGVTAPHWYNQDRRCITELVWSYAGQGAYLPAFTASIDAALTLVPEGWQMIYGQDVPERSFRRLSLNKGGFSPYFQGLAATPALALCAAALRARRL